MYLTVFPIQIGKLSIIKKLFIGVLMKEEKKEKKKDNQYKLKKAMAIAIGLITLSNCL